MTPSDYFLDVETSALGQPWRPRLDAAGELHALAIAQIGGHDELIARVLAGRGVLPDAVDRHLAPSFRDLMPDPYSLRDMAAATERLRRAVMAHEKVAIFGDYDVDGACSAALFSEYLKACGLETIVHIPDRVTEGYGPNVEAIQELRVARRNTGGDRRLRRRQSRAVRGREPAWPRRDRVRSPSGPGGAAEDGGAR